MGATAMTGALRAEGGARLLGPAVNAPQRGLGFFLLHHPLPLLRDEPCTIHRLLRQPLLLLLSRLRLAPPPLSFLHDRLVVLPTVVCVGQRLVRLLELLELLIRAALVRVLTLGPLSIRLADRPRAGADGHPKHLIMTHARTG